LAFVGPTQEVFMLGKIVAFAALLIAPTLIYADNLAGDAGPLELTVNAAGASNRELSAGGFTLNGSIGFFVLPLLELSVRDGVTYDDSNAGSTWDNTVRGAVDFALPLDRFEPYIGANVGYFASNKLSSSPEAAPEVGLKFFVTKSVFVYGQAEYDFLWRGNANNFNGGSFNYALGLGIRI
jgi:hypothetical protein